MKSFLVYKFICVSCSSSCIGETGCHFKTRIEEHINKDNKSHISNHLRSIETYFDPYNYLSFKIIDKANCKFDLKIKEALPINWRKSNLIAQQNHSVLTLSLQLLYPSFFSVFVVVVFSAFLFHILFSLSLTLTIGIFYCITYTSLLLHLITIHLVSHFFLSSIIFIMSTLIIGIFYCPNFTLLLLHLIITHLVNIFYNNYVINICPRQL